ncbi:MAG: ChaN family lipoprotein [Rhodospirillaceae bacterium]|nr:ChaN family lipoprotein [Rhodospirillaceae bacterium]
MVEKKFASPGQLVAAAARSDYIFLGENHENPDHHRLQAWLLRGLIDKGRRPAIVFEMIEETRQPALAAYQNNNPLDATGLGAAVDWGKTGWPAWPKYQPIADVAFEAGLPVFAGNPANHGKSLSAARRTRLGLDDSLSPSQRDAMLETIDAGHCRLVPKRHLTPMVTIQRARDAVLADNAQKASGGKRGAVLILGANHARKDYAAPTVLNRLHPGHTSLTMAFIEVDDELKAPSEYARTFGGDLIPFDYIWFTPRANNRYYCAELKQKFKKFKKHSPKPKTTP